MTENEILEGGPYKALLHYYGEERLDWTALEYSYDLLVYWDKVTVKNENDETIEITDLYAKITLSNSHLLLESPKLMRTSFSQQQWDAGYIHSHVRTGNYSWANPCLGRGALRSTITTLRSREGDYDMWALFALELDRYVHIESLKGGPHIKMSAVIDDSEELTTDYMFDAIYDSSDSLLCKAYETFIMGMPALKLSVSDLNIRPAYSYVEFNVMVTNTLIDFYNRYGYYSWVRGVLVSGRVVDAAHIAYKTNRKYDSRTFDPKSPQYLLTFKGESKYLNVFGAEKNATKGLIVSWYVCTYIYRRLCIDLNSLRWNL